jgi:dienelactone hydrolase
MMKRSLALLLLWCSVAVVAGCKKYASKEWTPIPIGSTETDPAVASFPDLGAGRTIESGINVQASELRRGSVPMRVWFYRPERATGRLSLILVPPAGSTCFLGMNLSAEDAKEHIPYVRAGFAVAAFDIDGALADVENAPDEKVFKAAMKFRDARAGLANLKVALDFILAKVPDIDPGHVYTAGHSSAGTLALLAGEHEPRIRAVATYAPVVDLDNRLAPVIPKLESNLPGFEAFVHESSPRTHEDKLKCPVFLFHAKDDTIVRPNETFELASRLRAYNSQITLVTPDHGGHLNGMSREGMPKAIEWFKSLENPAPPPAPKAGPKKKR